MEGSTTPADEAPRTRTTMEPGAIPPAMMPPVVHHMPAMVARARTMMEPGARAMMGTGTRTPVMTTGARAMMEPGARAMMGTGTRTSVMTTGAWAMMGTGPRTSVMTTGARTTRTRESNTGTACNESQNQFLVVHVMPPCLRLQSVRQPEVSFLTDFLESNHIG